jgi:uncharacterized membrane protein YraQ (UPF0718 family)
LLAVGALILAGLAWQRGGVEMSISGVIVGGKILLSVVPLLIAAFLIAGLVQVLVTSDLVQRWLGEKSGWKGIAIACLGGALIPGGPYVYFPIAAVLLKAGASLGVLVAFVVAKNIWSVSRLPLEFALLGSRLTLVRLLVTLILPPLLGFLSEAFFGSRLESIRKAVETS